MAEFHRKIELQSPDDLQYLVSNIRRAADAEIEKNLPKMDDGVEDDMRPRVEQLVEEVLPSIAAPHLTSILNDHFQTVYHSSDPHYRIKHHNQWSPSRGPTSTVDLRQQDRSHTQH